MSSWEKSMYVFGQYSWDKRRWKLNIKEDCECCSNDVNICYDQWYGDSPVDTTSKNKGAVDIIKKHFGYEENYTKDALDTLEEFMVMTSINDHRYYQPSFLELRYILTYEEAEVILSHCHREGWMEHGSGIRCSWLTDEGKEYIAKNMDKTSRESLEKELEEWLKTNMTEMRLL